MLSTENIAINIQKAAFRQKDRFSDYNKRYQGETIFLLGSGPSLTRKIGDKLRSYYTMGSGQIYRLYDNHDGSEYDLFSPDFYISSDVDFVNHAEAFLSQMARNGTVCFIPNNCDAMYKDNDYLPFYRIDVNHHFHWQYDKTFGLALNIGYNILPQMIQLAVMMGFELIILIGFDLSVTRPFHFWPAGWPSREERIRRYYEFKKTIGYVNDVAIPVLQRHGVMLIDCSGSDIQCAKADISNLIN